MTADNFDSDKGRTHDESELIATDAEIVETRQFLEDNVSDTIRERTVGVNGSRYLRILNRLAASEARVKELEAELAALRAKVTPGPHQQKLADAVIDLFHDKYVPMVGDGDAYTDEERSSALSDIHKTVSEWWVEDIEAHVAPLRAQLETAVGLLRRLVDPGAKPYPSMTNEELADIMEELDTDVRAFLATLTTPAAQKGAGDE